MIDFFYESPEKILLLRVETDKNDQLLKLPSFLKVTKEVTGYLSVCLALTRV
jgi:hypothetical protein